MADTCAESAVPIVASTAIQAAKEAPIAVMITDVLLAFDHLRHEVTVLANVVAEGDVERAYQEAAAAIADVRERLRGPVPQVGVRSHRAAELQLEPGLRRLRGGGRACQGVHPRG